MTRTKMEFVNLGKLRQSLPRAVALVAARHFAKGARVMILAGGQSQAEELDQALWAYDPGSFLPHAQAGGADQDREPVLIAPNPANLNQAQVLIMAQALDEPPLDEYGHIVQFVPAAEGPELIASRERYRALANDSRAELVHTTELG